MSSQDAGATPHPWSAPRGELLGQYLQHSEAPASPPPGEDNREIIIITGMSGAGRTTASDVLEDLGWYVVDNLPSELLVSLTDLAERRMAQDVAVPRIAVAVDVRSQALAGDLAAGVTALRQAGWRPWVLFIDANDAELVRRFEAVRRPHPVQGSGRLMDGIMQERRILGLLRAGADVVVDTSNLNVHQLSARITELVRAGHGAQLRLTVVSFGFKYGIPLDADIVFDLRFLPNPYWVPELRSHNGTESEVREFVLAQEGAEDFLHRVEGVLDPMIRGYTREKRRFVTIAFGCTGGKHRSVAMTEVLTQRLQDAGHQATRVHRDLGHE